MDTLTTILDILEEKQNIDPSEVHGDSSFDSLNIDSLDMVELMCEVEDRFDIDFGEPEGLETISDLVDYLDSLL